MATRDRFEYAHSIGIPADHPAFAGHFPGIPILPGAVLLDETLREEKEADEKLTTIAGKVMSSEEMSESRSAR